jgi:hypothetical protein
MRGPVSSAAGADSAVRAFRTSPFAVGFGRSGPSQKWLPPIAAGCGDVIRILGERRGKSGSIAAPLAFTQLLEEPWMAAASSTASALIDVALLVQVRRSVFNLSRRPSF